MSLKGVKGRMPAYFSTVHDIDTVKQPQGCGAQQGWNVQGKPPERVGGAVRFYARPRCCCWGRQPQGAIKHCGAADKAPTCAREVEQRLAAF
jgi:hypothetical protein